MKYALALLTLTFTLNAAAGCPLEAPEKMRTIEDLLECRGIMLSSSHYDELFNKATDAANAFNTQLRIYRENNETLAQN
jgi:hypothetical protein